MEEFEGIHQKLKEENRNLIREVKMQQEEINNLKDIVAEDLEKNGIFDIDYTRRW